MLSIHLHNIRMFAFHGLYEDEKVLGNEFELNVTVKHHPSLVHVAHMSQTIDYVAVYHLIAERMQQPTPLLETVITDMAHLILERFAQAEEVYLSIRKMRPPINHIEGSVGVSFEIKRSMLNKNS